MVKFLDDHGTLSPKLPIVVVPLRLREKSMHIYVHVLMIAFEGRSIAKEGNGEHHAQWQIWAKIELLR